jgi:hypothetical protein
MARLPGPDEGEADEGQGSNASDDRGNGEPVRRHHLCLLSSLPKAYSAHREGIVNQPTSGACAAPRARAINCLTLIAPLAT